MRHVRDQLWAKIQRYDPDVDRRPVSVAVDNILLPKGIQEYYNILNDHGSNKHPFVSKNKLQLLK